MDDESVVYAKKHKKDLIKEVTKNKVPSAKKTAIFMAGSPGAGKTEVATGLEEILENICMIDADIFRSYFPGYNGSNSNEFQRGSALLVEYAFDEVIKKGYSFILDGTFAIDKSVENIERALKRNYLTTIYYVYQKPEVAWEFTKQREIREGRHVPKERFVNAYLKANENIKKVKSRFGSAVEVIVVFKDYQNNISNIIEDVDNLAFVLPDFYTFEKLEGKLND